MNIIYFVRHGESFANITHQFSYKKKDYALTSQGILQAQQTAAYFKQQHIDEIYSSPFTRAVETASIIASTFQAPIIIKEQFREVNVGILEDHPTKENWALHDRIFEDWLNGRSMRYFPHGENQVMVLQRMREGLLEILNNKTGKHILIISHTGILRATIQNICSNVSLSELINIPNRNCSITEMEMEIREGTIAGTLKVWAFASHLTENNLSSRCPPDVVGVR